MLRRILFLLLLFATLLPLGARRRVVTGTVLAERDGRPVELATARLFPAADTARLVAGAVTDSLGRFRIAVDTDAPLRLRVGFVGLSSLSRAVTFPADADSVDVGTLRLAGNDIAMRAAVVRAVAARMEQQGDTTVFNAAAFRTPEGASLEALIKQLPGAEISADGTITVNGKTVKELLINGKDFFKGDTKVALKNLPTNLVSRVKSYDRKSDYAEQTGIDDGDDTFVLDITTKSELKHSLITNLDAAGGIDDERQGLYSGKAMLMRFSDSRRFGIFASHNNVGDRGFGGPRGFFGGDDGRTAATMLGSDFSWENGRKKYEAGRFEIGGNALFFRNDNRLESITSSQTFLTAGARGNFAADHSHARNISRAFHARLNLKWNPDSLTQLSFRPSYDFNGRRNTSSSRSATFDDDPFARYAVSAADEVLARAYPAVFPADTLRGTDDFLKNLNNNHALSRTDTHKFDGELHLTRMFGKGDGRSLTFTARGGYSSTAADSYSRADIYRRIAPAGGVARMAPDGTHQFAENPATAWNYRLAGTYVQPVVGKLLFETRYQYEHRYNSGDRSLYNLYGLGGYNTLADFLADHTALGSVAQLYLPGERNTVAWLDPAQLLSRLDAADVQAAVRDAANSRHATYRTDRHEVRLALRYNTKTVRLSAGVKIAPERTRLDYERPAAGRIDTVRSVLNFAPDVRLRYTFSKTTNLDFNYRGSSSQPSMTQLLNVVDNADPLRVSVGNPGLRPAWKHDAHLFFNSYDPEALRGLMAHADFGFSTGNVSQVVIYDDISGRRFARPENIDGNWNAAAGLTFNTPLDREKVLNLSTSTDANFTRSVGYVAASTAAAVLSAAPSADEVNALFDAARLEKSATRVAAFSERLDLAYRRSWWDVTLNGRVSYQHSRSSLLAARDLDTWSFAYGVEGNVNLPFGLAFSTDLRMTSRRGFSAAEFNTDELVWNAALSHSFLSGKPLTVRFEAYDLLNRGNNISRTLTALARTDTWNNSLNTYFLVRAIYRLNIFPGGKSPKREGAPDDDRRPGPGNFRPVMPGGGRPGGPMGPRR